VVLPAFAANDLAVTLRLKFKWEWAFAELFFSKGTSAVKAIIMLHAIQNKAIESIVFFMMLIF